MIQLTKLNSIIEGSLEAELPTIWTDGKALQVGSSSNVEKMRKGEDAGARKGREVAEHCVFPMFCRSGGSKSKLPSSRGSKSRLAKAAGAEPAGQMRDEKLHALVAQSAFPSKKCQNT